MKIACLTLVLLCALLLPCLAQKKNAGYFFKQGEAAIENGKYAMALAHLNECLRLDPYFWDAYPLRASARENTGDKKGALTDYNIYVDSRPDDPDALIGRAVLRYQEGQYEPAREDFLKLLKTPAHPTSKVFFRQTTEGTDKMFTVQESNHADLFNYLGLISIRLKDYHQAGVFLDSAVRLSPSDPQYVVNRGLLKEHLLDTAAAIADYQKAASIDPGNGAAIHNLAVIKRARGESGTSENLLNEAILQSPSLPEPYAARAWFYFRNKDYKQALGDYDKVISLNKEDAESWLYRGMVKEKLKDPDGAFADYTEAISLRNDYAQAWMARGTLLTKLNRLSEAVEDYTVALLWYPEFGLAFYNRGVARQKLGKLAGACDDLKAAEGLKIMVSADLKAKACP